MPKNIERGVTADELEASLAPLLEHADKYFEGVETEEEFFALLRLTFSELSKLFEDLRARGALTPEDAGRYQWASTIIPTFILTLERGPKYGSLLSSQLRTNLRSMLKGATVRKLRGPN